MRAVDELIRHDISDGRIADHRVSSAGHAVACPAAELPRDDGRGSWGNEDKLSRTGIGKIRRVGGLRASQPRGCPSPNSRRLVVRASRNPRTSHSEGQPPLIAGIPRPLTRDAIERKAILSATCLSIRAARPPRNLVALARFRLFLITPLINRLYEASLRGSR